MMWYAETKRNNWHLIRGWDAIGWYRQYLRNKWWESLTDEEKKKYEAEIEREFQKIYRLKNACLSYINRVCNERLDLIKEINGI